VFFFSFGRRGRLLNMQLPVSKRAARCGHDGLFLQCSVHYPQGFPVLVPHFFWIRIPFGSFIQGFLSTLPPSSFQPSPEGFAPLLLGADITAEFPLLRSHPRHLVCGRAGRDPYAVTANPPPFLRGGFRVWDTPTHTPPRPPGPPPGANKHISR